MHCLIMQFSEPSQMSYFCFHTHTTYRFLFMFLSTGAFPPPKGQKEAVSRAMTLDPVWLCIIQTLAFASGYMWYIVLQYLYCCLF